MKMSTMFNGQALTLGILLALATPAGCGSEDGQATDTAPEIEDTSPPDILILDTAEADTTVADTFRPPEPGEFGYPCEENLDCFSGWCVQTSNGRECTRTCLETCPDGYDCREAPGGDATFVCMPRFLNLCDPCRETTDCNAPGQSGNYCLGFGPEGRFCGAACNEDDDCPTSYVCRNVPVGGGAEAKQCVPPDGGECSCSPLAKELQKATTCFVENDNGKCEGTRFCLQSGLSQCDAKAPLPESCNQLDDNCDSRIDELAPDYVCQITNEFGSCPGRGTCTDGFETCIGTAPSPDVCDLIDNDCDGETDNGLCDDLNPCTKDSCDPNTGNCIHVNDNTRLCDDGSVCTQVDKCQDGVCTGYNPLSCEDGNPCTLNDTCNQGVCVPGGANPCNDNNECTVDSCQTNVGCKNDARPNATACTKSGLNQCQTSECQNGQCVAKNINSTAQNPFICNLTGECSEGYCANGTCRALGGSPCRAEVDYLFCTEEIDGLCTVSGECTPTEQPNQCDCGACNSFCATLCGTFCVCLDFLFN